MIQVPMNVRAAALFWSEAVGVANADGQGGASDEAVNATSLICLEVSKETVCEDHVGPFLSLALVLKSLCDTQPGADDLKPDVEVVLEWGKSVGFVYGVDHSGDPVATKMPSPGESRQ